MLCCYKTAVVLFTTAVGDKLIIVLLFLQQKLLDNL